MKLALVLFCCWAIIQTEAYFTGLPAKTESFQAYNNRLGISLDSVLECFGKTNIDWNFFSKEYQGTLVDNFRSPRGIEQLRNVSCYLSCIAEKRRMFNDKRIEIEGLMGIINSQFDIIIKRFRKRIELCTEQANTFSNKCDVIGSYFECYMYTTPELDE